MEASKEMRAVPQIVSFIDGGRLDVRARQQIKRLFSLLEGRRVRLTVEEVKRKRSNNQNAYYWGVVVPMVQELFKDAGTDAEAQDIHEFLKGYVGGMRKVVVVKGKPYTILQSTASLGTIEFEDYLEKIRAWAAGIGLQIPFPHERIDNEQC